MNACQLWVCALWKVGVCVFVFRIRRRPLRTAALAIDCIQRLIPTSWKMELQKGMKCGEGRVQSLQKNQGSVL